MTPNDSHYPTVWARRADLIVHIAGLGLALFGGGVALGLAVSKGMLGLVAAVSIYAVGLIAMLAFSLSYNFAKPTIQPILRRLDHAGIFLMIAASYTPFTTFALEGTWAWGMTAAVWTLAVLGMAGKLFLPGLGQSDLGFPLSGTGLACRVCDQADGARRATCCHVAAGCRWSGLYGGCDLLRVKAPEVPPGNLARPCARRSRASLCRCPGRGGADRGALSKAWGKAWSKAREPAGAQSGNLHNDCRAALANPVCPC
jgi:hypothetical protein